MTDEGYVCIHCGAESWFGGDSGVDDCEHEWHLVWSTEDIRDHNERILS